MATPLHALVPYGPSREPGLFLITPGGHIRFWDSLGIGLAGGDHYSSSSLDLADDERVTTLTRADVSLLHLNVCYPINEPSSDSNIYCVDLCRTTLPPDIDIIGRKAPSLASGVQPSTVVSLAVTSSAKFLVER